MAQWEIRISALWNRSTVFAVILITISTVITAFAFRVTPSPGISIGLLATAAAVMSIRLEMRIWEKMWWLVLIVILVVTEIQSIQKNDAQNLQNQANLNQSFREIASGIEKSYLELHALKGEFDAQIGTPPAPVVAAQIPLSTTTKKGPTSSPKVNIDITAVFAHGDAPPPSRRILKLWVTITNDRHSAKVLVNQYGLIVRIPEKGDFPGHPSGPFTDDTRFVPLIAETGNRQIEPGGEIQGNLMFIVDDLPVTLDSDQNIQLILSARVNGIELSKTETIAEIRNR